MVKHLKLSIIPLVCIILLAAFIRFYRLNDIPPGVNRDEASIGYTALSLIKTGKDEYGRSFPLSFESFGDWKLPLYIYATVPSVKLFGLNEFAVRFPSAAAGVITVLLTYFFIAELFVDTLSSDTIPLVGAFFLAISPWSVHLSRTASEANFAVMLVILSVFLWLKALKGKSVYFLISFPLLALTFWTYASNHVFSVLLVIVLLFLSRKKIRHNRYAYGGILMFVILAAIIFSQTLFSADTTKLAGISIFGDPTVIHTAIELPRSQNPQSVHLIAQVLYNRMTFAATAVFQNYLNAFSPEFLFIRGGTNHAHNILDFGNLYLAEAPLFYLGIVYVLTKRKHTSNKLLLLWLFISPIASSLTKDAPHTARIFDIYPLPPILSTLGLVWIQEQVKNKKIFTYILILFFLIFTINIGVYVDRYFVLFPRNEAENWGYGYKKLTLLLNTPAYQGKQVIMSRPEFSPYIFLLFYSSYDPHTYQQEAQRYPLTSDGFVNVKSFGRFQFRNVNWKKDICLPSYILIDFIDGQSPYIYPTSHVIRLPDGSPYLQVYETPTLGCPPKLLK